MLMTLQEIAEAVQGKLVGTDATVSGVCIDTRILAEGDLYIAIKGEQFDGHDFIAQAEKKGALALLVAKQVTSDKPQIIVKDTRLALAQLAGAVRAKVQVKVCGITGSNGKTTVKEMVAAVLAVNYRVLFTQGNFNNAIGVPLTLLRLQAEDEFAVIEMGANHAGEIAYTSAYAQPDVVVITNVGAAHIEGFGSIEGIALAKAEIIESLTDQGIAVLNADDTFFTQWLALAGQRKVLSFGLNANADVTAENIVTGFAGEQFCTQFDLLSEGKRVPIRLALAGEHNVKNALAASSACLALGIEVKQIQEGLKQVKAVKGRLQLSVTGLGYRVINDTYNANPDSLTVALAVLKNCEGELWLALGAFGELGAGAEQLHSEMGQKIKQAGVMRLFVTGALAKSTVKAFGVGAEFFTQQEDLITAVQQAINPKVVLLVKGSRVQRMENVVNALVNKVEK
nr:UDP-N-acetylmuramoyl-tripeptide--D-alanyl-D-alanine ligase [methanotrophic endosymbiont of Bathymodiolus puteoserpentis (Logatchev)]